MKKILFLGCAFFLFTAATQAQSTDTNTTPPTQQHMRQHKGGAMGMMGGQLAKKLNLTEDQKTQLKGVNDSFRTDREAIKNNATLNDDQKKQAYRDLFKKNSDARNAIYTPEQKAIIAKEMQERRAKRGNRKSHAPKADAGQ